MYVVDRRDRIKKEIEEEDMKKEFPGDSGRWLDGRSGNAILVADKSGGREIIGGEMLRCIFGV